MQKPTLLLSTLSCILTLGCTKEDNEVVYHHLQAASGPIQTEVTVHVYYSSKQVDIKTIDGVWNLGAKKSDTEMSECTIFDAKNWHCTDEVVITPPNTKYLMMRNEWIANGESLVHKKWMVSEERMSELDNFEYTIR